MMSFRKILCLFAVSLLFIPFANAKSEIVEYINDVSSEITNWNDINFTPSIKTDDGYVYFVKKKLIYVDNSGKEKWTYSISKDGNTAADILLDGDYIVFTKGGRNGETGRIKLSDGSLASSVPVAGMKIAKLDSYYIVASGNGLITSINSSDGSIVKELETDYEIVNMVSDQTYIYVMSSYGEIVKYDKNLKEVSNLETDFNEVYDTDYLNTNSTKGLFTDSLNYYISNFNVYKIDSKGNSSIKLNGDYECEDGTCTEYHSGTILKDYIVIGGVDYKKSIETSAEEIDINYNNYVPFVEIYDKNFNLLQRIDLSKEINDWAVVKDVSLTENGEGFLVKWIDMDNSKLHVTEYRMKYNVETKTDGNGTVKVSINRAISGTVVTFTVVPNEGYVLSVVKVTDANGNFVYFKDYTFTMPTADVIVEATFVKKENKIDNPETGAYIGIVTAAFLVGGGLLLLNNKKRKNTKKYEKVM